MVSADDATETVTLALPHGLGNTGESVSLRVLNSTIGGLNNGNVHVFDIVDALRLRVVGWNLIRSDGIAVLRDNGNIHSNITAIGFNAEPDKSNQVILGDTNIVEVKTSGKIIAGETESTDLVNTVVTKGYFESEIPLDNGFIKLPTLSGTNPPLPADCNAPSHIGRMIASYSSSDLYVCMQSGAQIEWVVK